MSACCERCGWIFSRKSHASASEASTTESNHECWFFAVVGATNGNQLLWIHARHTHMHGYVGLLGNSCNTLSGSQSEQAPHVPKAITLLGRQAASIVQQVVMETGK